MNQPALYRGVLVGWAVLAAVVFVVLLRIPAAYGRHARRGWGPALPALLGWVLMELPAPVGVAVFFALAPRRGPVEFALLALWELHYVQRTFVYPWLRRHRARPIPLSIVAMGFAFNVVNAWLQGYGLFHLAAVPRPTSWLADPRFLLGSAVFLGGWVANVHSDTLLLRLRRPGETGYRIPFGGLFRWVSCPNYLGEVVEWCGWALLTWSPAGAVFAWWTAANLVPRALTHHRWYRERFPDYPRNRRAIFPGLL